MRFIFAPLLLVALVTVSTAQPSSWIRSSGTPLGDPIVDIDSTWDNYVLLTLGGTLGLTRGNDGSWITRVLPEPGIYTAATTNRQGYVVGGFGTVLRSDDGVNWSPSESPIDAVVYDIAYARDVVLLVGSGNTMRRSTDHGRTWQAPTRAVAGTFAQLIVSWDTVIAIASEGHLARSTDLGATWDGIPGPSGHRLVGGYPDNGIATVATEAGEVYRRSDSGEWTLLMSIPLPSSGRWDRIRFGSVDHVRYIVATSDWPDGNEGTLLRSEDYGVTWRSQLPQGMPGLNAYFVYRNGWMLTAGSSGWMANSTDGGSTWSFTPPEQNLEYVRAYAFGDDDAVLISYKGSPGPDSVRGHIRSSTDGGRTWIDRDPRAFGTIRDGSFSDLAHGILVGDSTRVTIDGGATWTVHPGGGESVAMLDSVRILRTAGNQVQESTDGGATWTTTATLAMGQPFRRMYFTTPLLGTIIGNGGNLYLTNDGGRTWSEATSLAGVGSVNDGCHVSERIIAAVGDGFAARSTDEGATWTRVVPTFHGESVPIELRSVAFSDVRNGLAVGETGVAARTDDGGVSWQVDVTGSVRDLLSVAAKPGGEYLVAGKRGTIFRTTTPTSAAPAEYSAPRELRVTVASAERGSRMRVRLTLAAPGEVNVALYSADARLRTAIDTGILPAGVTELTLPGGIEAAGEYFVVARGAGRVSAARVVVR